jgi:hypothetical protein
LPTCHLYPALREQTETNPTSQWTLRRVEGAADGRFRSLNRGSLRLKNRTGYKIVGAKRRRPAPMLPRLRARMKKPTPPLKKRDPHRALSFPIFISGKCGGSLREGLKGVACAKAWQALRCRYQEYGNPNNPSPSESLSLRTE